MNVDSLQSYADHLRSLYEEQDLKTELSDQDAKRRAKACQHAERAQALQRQLGTCNSEVCRENMWPILSNLVAEMEGASGFTSLAQAVPGLQQIMEQYKKKSELLTHWPPRCNLGDIDEGKLDEKLEGCAESVKDFQTKPELQTFASLAKELKKTERELEEELAACAELQAWVAMEMTRLSSMNYGSRKG